MASKEAAMLPWPELGATLLPEIADNRKLRHQLLETASAHSWSHRHRDGRGFQIKYWDDVQERLISLMLADRRQVDRRQSSSRALSDVDYFLSTGENQVETLKVGLECQGRIIYQCRWSLLKEESAGVELQGQRHREHSRRNICREPEVCLRQ